MLILERQKPHKQTFGHNNRLNNCVSCYIYLVQNYFYILYITYILKTYWRHYNFTVMIVFSFCTFKTMSTFNTKILKYMCIFIKIPFKIFSRVKLLQFYFQKTAIFIFIKCPLNIDKLIMKNRQLFSLWKWYISLIS